MRALRQRLRNAEIPALVRAARSCHASRVSRIHRRDLVVGGALAGLTTIAGCASEPEEDPSEPEEEQEPSSITGPIPPPASFPRRVLGRTGEKFPILGLGGEGALEAQDEDAALRVIDRAFELGIRYFDTAWSYARSEQFLGQALQGRRDQVYLASKAGLRDGVRARELLEKSLTFLRTNRLDLWQIHDIRTHQDVDQILAPDGILATAIRAKEEGLCRHLGITGHCFPGVLERLLDVYPFDTVLMALNAAESYERPFRDTALAKAVAKGTGIIGMKVLARGAVLGAITLEEAMHWVLSLPIHMCIVAADTVEHVEQNVRAAYGFKPLGERRMAEIQSRALKVGDAATFFRRGIWAQQLTL